MKLGLRSKLFLASFGLISVCFAAADVYLTRGLDAGLVARIEDDLFVRLSLIERDASGTPEPLDDTVAWDKLADALGERAHARVTIILKDGSVIGDSEVDAAALPSVANHAGRPEVVAAHAYGRGTATRRSETTTVRQMYAAIPFRRGQTRAGAVRIAVPLTEVDSAIARLHKLVFLATALALGAAALMSSLSAHFIARSIRTMTAAARRMASGDLDVRTRIAGDDEAAELSSALDQLAAGLSSAIRALRDERDLLAAILDGMQEGVMLVDEAGRLVRVNPALRAMLLLAPETTGKPLLEVVRNADLSEIFEEAWERPASGEIELGGLKPRRVLVRAAPLSPLSPPSPHERARTRFAVFVDVTDIRRLELMRRDFVANVSHELRTPVTAVLSAAETLDDALTGDPDAAARFVDIIRRNAERLQRLIEDLLDLSKIESKELRLHPEAVELGPFVAHALSLSRGRAEERRVRLSADVDPTCPAVTADRRALEQVLTNLIDNAVKYCPGAEILVTARRAPSNAGRVELVVRDTGPGIEAKHLPRLFERFYRVDAGRSREMGGTGLGLSIVKHLVDAMGGEVSVTSELGAGSTFTVSLPSALART